MTCGSATWTSLAEAQAVGVDVGGARVLHLRAAGHEAAHVDDGHAPRLQKGSESGPVAGERIAGARPHDRREPGGAEAGR